MPRSSSSRPALPQRSHALADHFRREDLPFVIDEDGDLVSGLNTPFSQIPVFFRHEAERELLRAYAFPSIEVTPDNEEDLIRFASLLNGVSNFIVMFIDRERRCPVLRLNSFAVGPLPLAPDFTDRFVNAFFGGVFATLPAIDAVARGLASPEQGVHLLIEQPAPENN